MIAPGMVPARPAARGALSRLFVVGAAVLWGTTGTAQALAPAGATPVAVGAVRLVGGSVLLVALAVVTARDDLRVRRWPVLVVAAVAILAYQLTFFGSVARTGVALGTVVGIGSAPVATGLLGFALRGERPEAGWGWSTLLAVSGCALLLAPGQAVRVDVLGVVLALAAGTSYAAYTLASKSLLDTGQSPIAVMALAFGGAAVLAIPLLLIADVGWVTSWRGGAVAAWLAVATLGLSYVLFGRGLAGLATPTVATLSLAEPLTAALLGLVVLGERPGLLGALGGLLVVSGLAVLAAPRRVGR